MLFVSAFHWSGAAPACNDGIGLFYLTPCGLNWSSDGRVLKARNRLAYVFLRMKPC